MASEMLRKAHRYEDIHRPRNREELPVFHVTGGVGWINDPNGFAPYKGEYHLFFQYYPYDVQWGPMHWGHVKTRDFIRWEFLPCALAPDMEYDKDGCFSGGSVELPDGRHLLMYTGVRKVETEEGKVEDRQTQCIAIGNGVDYEKCERNPVITGADLPEGGSIIDFRDPKIWQEADGTYRCVVGTRIPDKEGAILLFSSPDGFRWKYESILIQNDGRFGMMWECPDFFELDGKHVLLCSPQDMLPEGFEYHNGNGTLCLIGELDGERKQFTYAHNQSVDYGIDFYAPQTTLAPDGRRIMIAWMQNWDTCDQNGAQERKWFGQMTLPRELTIQNGRLYQKPIRELDQHRSNKVEYKNVTVDGNVTLPGIEGRVVDLEITIRPKDKDAMYRKFGVWFAQNEKFRTTLSYRPYESTLKIDRKHCGSRRAYIHQRRSLTPYQDGEVKLRLILDKYSVEVFINDGEQVMTATFMTDLAAKGISFCADGQVEMDITKYDLFAEE